MIEPRTWSMVLLSLALGSGCSSAGTFLQQRGRDLADCVHVTAGYGLGLSATVKVTDGLTIIVGRSETHRYGLGWRELDHWKEQEGGAIFIGGRGVYAVEDDHPLARRFESMLLMTPVDLVDLRGRVKRRPVELANVDVGCTLGVVTARVGFSPGELVDFLGGWFGADLGGDDVPAGKPASGPGSACPRG